MSKSSTTTIRGDVLPNPHPGVILLEEFLKPMGVSQNALARAIHVPPRRINELVLGKRAVTADTDLRLARRRVGRVFPGAAVGLRIDGTASGDRQATEAHRTSGRVTLLFVLKHKAAHNGWPIPKGVPSWPTRTRVSATT
jgi:antitoxin HigA-1